MKIKKSIKKIFNLCRFFFSNYSRKIFLFYFILIFIGAVLLFLPFSIKSHNEIISNHKWNFLDALFTSVSAITDTGLVIGVTNSQFNILGLIIIDFNILFIEKNNKTELASGESEIELNNGFTNFIDPTTINESNKNNILKRLKLKKITL